MSLFPKDLPFNLFDRPLKEPSQFIGFSGNDIDRQSEKRSDESTALALADPRARIMLIRNGTILLKKQSETEYDPYFSVADAVMLEADLGGAVLLGFDQLGPVVAAPGGFDAGGDDAGGPDVDGVYRLEAVDFRSVNIKGLISYSQLGAMAQAASLLAWHASHRFCGKCGNPTDIRAGGYKRICPSCSAEHFPRTDPVVIMLAVTRESCLLGRGRHFGAGMFSALAGFVEPGETIEGAVRRETLEESGIRLGRVAYHASQPWPFPYSLMIGCFGEALNEDIQADLEELEACRWFSRDEVLSMLKREHPDGLFVPPRAAIAHHLIRHWAEAT